MDNTTTAAAAAHHSLLDADSLAVSERVVESVAEVKGTTPLELNPPLFSAVDPEALDALVRGMVEVPGEPAGRVEFSYCGCTVAVDANGTIDVTEIRHD